jgi:phage host-nuclease inhibitor protein Gam
MATSRKKKPPVTALSDVSAVNDAVEEIGKNDAKLARIHSTQKRRVDAANAAAAAQGDPLVARNALLKEQVEEFANKRWDEITTPDAPETAILRTGVIERRFNPPSLVVEEGKTSEVIAALKKLRGGRSFVRVKEEIDKVKLKARPEIVAKIKGLSIVSEREIHIKPGKPQTEPVRRAKKS